MKDKRKVQIIASDAGGTMTDMIVVDADGRFRIGKAATTPDDQALGVWEALGDAKESLARLAAAVGEESLYE